MAPEKVIKSLEEVSRGYKVFEKDQVLTEEQLNRLADYLDDQQRLTRVALLGVGIACGLRVAVADGGAGLLLTKGVGVTTDGDLMRVPADLTYRRFRVYDQTAPVYAPFYDGADMRKVIELTADDVSTALPLDRFTAQTQKKLTDMTAVLMMESYVKDGDLCTGGDCDNKGKDGIHNVKLLLLEQKDIDALRETLPTPDRAARQLEPATADRAQLGDTIATVAALAKVYRDAGASTSGRLKAELAKVFKVCAAFLGDVFEADPAPRWSRRLDPPAGDIGMQYYYDFLKDLVETYNAFRDALFGEVGVCCPPLGAFPKHLLLGAVGASSLDGDTNRTGFYPSSLVRAGAGNLEHARFLARKIDTVVNSFKIDAATPISVTPSQGEDRPLEERAIPSYYVFDRTLPWPIHRAWSYSLERRGMAQFNYSARAREYEARGAALEPLRAQIGGFRFFRVEGHLGKQVSVAVAELEQIVRANNLPFTVRAVLLGAERPKIVVKPPIRYNDLHRLHHLVRQDLAYQLDAVVKHNEKFKEQVDRALTDKLFENRSLSPGVSIGGFAGDQKNKVEEAANKTKENLSKSYTSFKKADRWQDDMREAVTQATEMRAGLGDVARTEFATPVDSLVSNNHMLWVDWLDRIIETKDETEDDKLLFKNFIRQHPAAEHLSGVARGGTFVLVYDGDGTVVADVMLPYWWQEPAEPQPEEAQLPPPKVRPGILIDKGWRVLTPVDNLIQKNIRTELDGFKRAELEPIRQQNVEFQKNYVQAFKDSVNVMVGTRPTDTRVPTGPAGPVIRDATLDGRVRDTQSKTEKVDEIRRMIMDPSVDAARLPDLDGELKRAERDLAASVVETSKLVTAANIDPKTDGAAAMTVVAEAFSKLSNENAARVATTVKTDLDAAGAAAKPETKVMIRGVLRGRGFPG